MPVELVFVICLAVLFFLCIKVKTNEFISLLAAAAVMGLLSGMSGTETVEAIISGSADTFADIGIVIIFGIMLGNYLDAARATNRMALDTVRLMGKQRSGLAMAITGYIVSIPVFSDAAFVILNPLVKALHRKTRVPLAILAVSLSAGLLATHVYVPPTPGPLAAAGLLGIEIGDAILYGGFAALFMTAFGWIFAELFFRNKPDSYYNFRDEAARADIERADDTSIDDPDLPGTLASLIPLLLPILLIVLNTTSSMLFPEDSPLLSITSFIGDPNIAIPFGAILAIIMLGKKMGGKKVLSVMDDTLKDAGPIVFTTVAGGALGEILKASGAGAGIAEMVSSTGLPFILIPFVISAILKIVQGSGTVAVTTAASVCAPIAATLGLNPILIFMASGAGARACCHVNDSYFWVYTNYMGYDMKTGLKTLSISNVAMSLGGLLATFIASLWL